MRICLTLCVLVGVLVFAANPPQALSQADDHGLIVAIEPNGPKADIHLRISGDTTSASTYLYIRHTDSADLVGVQLFAQLANKSGQPLSGISTTLTISNTDVAQAGFTIPATKQVRVGLLVSNITATGLFTGQLVLEYAGNFINVVPLIVERYPLPALTIVGANAATGLQLNAPVPDFHYQFRIESTNRAPIDALQLAIAPFVGPNSRQSSATWSVNGQAGGEQTLPLAGLGAATVDVTATLPLTGTYTSAITLIYADKRESTPLVIQRFAPQPPVEVLGVETTRAEFFGLGGDVNLWMALHETAGQALTLNPPTLTTLDLNGAGQERNQAAYDGLSLTNEQGKVVSPTLTLDENATQRLKLTVLGLRGAGTYTGNLRVTAPGMRPLDRPITILMKISWLQAGLFILLGVLASSLIRYYIKTRRPRLIMQRRTLILRDDLETLSDTINDATEAERRMIATLSRRLEKLARDIDLGNDSNAEATLNEIDAKISCIPIWITLRRRVAALQPPELGAPFCDELQQIGDLLNDSDPASAEKARTQLQALPAKIDAAIKQKFIEQVDAVIAEVQAQIDKPAAQSQEFVDLKKTMEQAKASAVANEMDNARHTFDAARISYVNLLIDELDANLPSAAPLGLADPAWQQLKAEVQQKLHEARQSLNDPEQASDLYKDAYGRYLDGLVNGLLIIAEQLRKVIAEGLIKDKDDSAKYAQNTAWNTSVTAIIKQLDQALKDIKGGRLDTAAQSYTTAADAFRALLAERAQQMGVIAGIIARITAALPITPGEQPTTPVPERTQRFQVQAQAINWQLILYDALLALSVAIVAVVLGLQLLWVNDATWGSWGDHVTAFLWGLGLHQVSGAAFAGPTALQQQIVGA
jgi:hypothetical protein